MGAGGSRARKQGPVQTQCFTSRAPAQHPEGTFQYVVGSVLERNARL